MAFPTRNGALTGAVTPASATHNITLPSSVPVGMVIEAIVSFGIDTTISLDAASGGNWTISQQADAASGTGVVRSVRCWKFAEGGDVLRLVASAVARSTYVSYWVDTNVAPQASVSFGSSVNSNPPALTPSGGAKDYLWVAARSGDAMVVATAAPANYGNLLSIAGDSTANGSTAVADRQLNAASEDPGAFTSANEQWVCWTIAYEPAVVTPALTITPLVADGVVYDTADGSTVSVALTGSGVAGQAIQVCGYNASGSTAWTAGTIDGAGNWAVTLVVPSSQWGLWYQPRVRYGTNDATAVTGGNSFGAGHCVAPFGQSELEHWLAVASNFSQMTYPTLAAENVTVITQAAGGSIQMRRLTAATAILGNVNVGIVALANFLYRMAPGRKWMIVDAAESGTSRASLMADGDDGSGGRKWSDLAAMVAYVRSLGSEIGHVLECWYNADADTIQTFLAEWAPFYFGERAAGGAFTLGTVNPDSVKNPTRNVDHCLWDITAAADAFGRGLFMRGRTKWHVLTPMGFHDVSTGTEQTNFSDTVNGGGRIAQLDRPARDAVEAFAADSRVQTFLGSVGPSAHLVDFGGGIHPLTDDGFGVPQMALMFAPLMLRIAGQTVAEPQIVGTEAPAGGAYFDVLVSLPNGGNLTTRRQLLGLAAPATPPPHWQQVVGLELRRAGQSDAQRRPIFAASQTSYPAAHRGTVTIVDPGSGSGAARRGRVRVVPAVAIAATGDKVEYLRGEASAELLAPRDPNAKLVYDMLIEHVPAMYDAAALYPYIGVPVKPQPATLDITPATGAVADGASVITVQSGGAARVLARAAGAVGITVDSGGTATVSGAVGPSPAPALAALASVIRPNYVVQGDTLPMLAHRFDPPVDLTGATLTVDMVLRGGAAVLNDVPATIAAGTYLIDGVATVLSAADGVALYAWAAADTQAVGIYDVRFTATWPGGARLSSPATQPLYLIIAGDLA